MSEQIPIQETLPHQINTSPELAINDLIDGRFAVLPKPHHLITHRERESKKHKVPIAETGLSHVYLAQDITTREDVAVKLHHNSDELSLARQNRERVMAQKLVHANIIPMVATGVHVFEDGKESPYIATRYAPEGDLRREQVVNEESAYRVIRFMGEAALALDYLHRNGIVHRDVKPANIVHDKEHAYLGDFGTADVIHLQNDSEPLIHTPLSEEVSKVDQMQQNTRVGVLIGTPAYMSPQRATGEAATPGDDIFAWGASAFQELANQSAFRHRSENTIGMLPYFGAGEPISSDHLPDFVPEDIIDLIYASIEKNPENRPPIQEITGLALAA